MPATFDPINDDVFAAVRKGDEQALERLFRDHYDALLEEAVRELDDPFYAPKVVEAAVLRMWSKRAEFETPAALEQSLHQSVHEAAMRDIGRRAAVHRRDQREGAAPRTAHHHPPPTRDEIWAHIMAALHAGSGGAEQAKAKAELSRHLAAEHMSHVVEKRSPVKTAIYVLAIFAVVSGIMYGLFRDTPEKLTGRLLASSDASDIMSTFGQIGTATLDDGSKATIGADSRLRIPPGYGTEVRAVQVAGTASFEVAAGHRLPFEVRIGNAAVVATGTKFAVAFDTASQLVTVRVDEGKVDVRVLQSKLMRSLGAGEAVVVEPGGTLRDTDQKLVEEALAWTEGRLVIHDRPLREALEQIRRWYGIALLPADMSLMDRKVSVDASLESSREMIADLESSGTMEFGWEDKTMVLYDATTRAKPRAPAAKGKR